MARLLPPAAALPHRRPHRREGRRSAGLLAALLLLLCGGGAAPAAGEAESPEVLYRLTLDIRDPEGVPLEARVRVLGSNGQVYPGVPDSSRLSFWGAGGYFYVNGSGWVDVPAGTTRVTVGRGFEWKPYDRTFPLLADSTLSVVLTRFTDMAAEGWYGGELHAHTHHPPIDYEVPPEKALEVARAEGLHVVHLLDQAYEFTGAPHALSDSATILYFAYEHRNQTYGHVHFPGLRVSVPTGCCQDPSPAFPMVWDVRSSVVPDQAAMAVLAHPHSTDDYFFDDGWPGTGLGRELPVLAALGGLDAVEVVSYGNDPYEDWEGWYDLLSAGIPTALTTGTDSRLCSTSSMPVGSWRVYAQLGPGAPLDYDDWVSALKAGRTFITNYPLIPDFQVGGVLPGGVLDVSGDTLATSIHLRALCALGLQRVSILAEGQEVWAANFTGQLPPVMEVDTTFTIEVPTPAWIVAKLEGGTSHPHAFHGVARAVTNAVRISRLGVTARRTAPSGRYLDKLNLLEQLVEQRGNWVAPADHDTVLARIQRSRSFFRSAFVLAPNPFALLVPAEGETARSGQLAFDWEDATDPEEGDKIRYTLWVSSDSTLASPLLYVVQNSEYGNIPLVPERRYWWAVDALDRNGNTTRGTPSVSSFYLRDSALEVDTPPPAAAVKVRPRGVPNPSRGMVLLLGVQEPVTIFDVAGRRVASPGSGILRRGDDLYWDGTVHGHPAPPGLYWARGSGAGAGIRLLRIP